MERFIITQNIARYKMLLQTESDTEVRRKIVDLLEAEIDKVPASEKCAEIAKNRSF